MKSTKRTKKKVPDQRRAMSQFLKTNTAGDFANWLKTMPKAQVKRVELVTKQGNILGFQTEMKRIESNLATNKF